MEGILEYESDTLGLWGRFITKLIASWLLTYFMSVYLSTMIIKIVNPFISLFLILIALVIVTWVLFRENPLKWRNKVIFDFEKEVVRISNSKDAAFETDILDFQGKEYAFKDIENYSTIHYESFLFSAYYMIKIFVNGEEIKLLSLKSANEFTKLNSIFNNSLNIKPK